MATAILVTMSCNLLAKIEFIVSYKTCERRKPELLGAAAVN